MPEAEAQVLAAVQGDVVVFRPVGRVTFKVSKEFREYVAKVFAAGAKSLILDLADCATMDSTFMGVLAMIGIEGRKRQARLLVVNAGESNRKLLNDIGVSRVWSFSDTPVPETELATLCEAAKGAVSTADVADLVLAAHQTLMDLDEANIPKFKNVVELLSLELGK
jgi:anti-anti-sigma factor